MRLLTTFRREPFSLYEQLVGSRVKDKSLYEEALTHKSMRMKDTSGSACDNERLEFLGDAIIEAVVSDELYARYPDKKEGFLTTARSKVVKRETLNEIARQLRLEEMIKRDEGVDCNSVDFLGNALEALVGAVYLDLGYDAAKYFIRTHILDHIDMNNLLRNDINYKSKIVEWAQKRKAEIRYDERDEIRDNRHVFYVSLFVNGKKASDAWGFSKKEAQQRAAGDFLRWANKHQQKVKQFL